MSGEWEAGLFECFADCKICVVSWLCASCQVSQQLATVEGHECGIIDWVKVICCPICCQVSTRGRIRTKYNIQGSCCADLLISMFCGVCAITQQTRELAKRGDKPGGCFMEK